MDANQASSELPLSLNHHRRGGASLWSFRCVAATRCTPLSEKLTSRRHRLFVSLFEKLKYVVYTTCRRRFFALRSISKPPWACDIRGSISCAHGTNQWRDRYVDGNSRDGLATKSLRPEVLLFFIDTVWPFCHFVLDPTAINHSPTQPARVALINIKRTSGNAQKLGAAIRSSTRAILVSLQLAALAEQTKSRPVPGAEECERHRRAMPWNARVHRRWKLGTRELTAWAVRHESFRGLWEQVIARVPPLYEEDSSRNPCAVCTVACSKERQASDVHFRAD
ncbi:hypothetical protein IMY05_C2503000200 [Salix suchowensis]|nr:hypothetical protein IMY05_C2503000200 [Salix suchowensis]